MQKIFFLIVAFSFIVVSSDALECKKQKDDLKSVRDIIQTSPKTMEKDIGLVNGFRAMFNESKTGGQIRSVYASYAPKDMDEIYATAIGGSLKYELAKYDGINAGFALTFSEDIEIASGDLDKQKRNDELSSSEKKYAQLSEAYLAYEGCLFDYKLGRQIIDTPLADSDDIRMVQNTFEGIIVEYPSDEINIKAGYLSRWQGYDVGLDEGWIKTGENGTAFIGAAYSDIIELSVWHYNISSLTSASYLEGTYVYELNEGFFLGASLQYLNERELKKSGIEADIYGAMAELGIYNMTLGVAYNSSKSKESKESFSGFGGGTLFTNMDIMIIDEITQDRDAASYVGGISYKLGDLSLLYAYGSFKGKSDSSGERADIVEQDMGLEYNFNDEFVAYLMYVKSQDRLNTIATDYDYDHLRVMMNYNF